MQKIIEPKVGVVVLTRDRKGFVKDCLTSLRKNTYKNKKIVLINNVSNKGFAEGNNSGITYLLKHKCEYILLINDDTVSEPHLISKLISCFCGDLSIGIVGSTITYFDKPNTIWYDGGSFNRLFCFTTHSKMNKNIKYARSRYTDFITGCCMMVRKQVFEDIGLLDNRFGYYFEDVYFCKKALEKKYKSFVIKDTLVRHRVSSTLGNIGTNMMTPLRSYYFARNPFFLIKNENNIFFKITQTIGQFIIRFPYYLLRIYKEKQKNSFSHYVLGLKHGLIYLFWDRLYEHLE